MLVDSHDAAGGTYVRNLFQDFSQAPGFNPNGAVISYISFSVSGIGSATFGDLRIGAGIPVPPPVIELQPQPATVTAGGSAAFTVAASSPTSTTYQWQRLPTGGNTWNNLSANANFSGVATTTLTLTGAAEAMNGDQFRCVVSNSGGSTTSSAATLTVMPAMAPSFTLQPQNQTVMAGNAAVFAVGASGNPSPGYQWHRRPAGSNTWSNPSDGAVYSGVTTAALTVSGTVTSMNSDQFRCVASNSFGSVTSRVATLTVDPAVTPPLILTRPKSVTVPVGGDATFSVLAEGTLPLSYQWRFNGTDIPAATNTSFALSNIQPIHDGFYTVIITNVAGSATSPAATLTVVLPIQIVKGQLLQSGAMELEISSGIGKLLEIQASTNLTSWSQLGRLTNGLGTAFFVDQMTGLFQRRYYRIANVNQRPLGSTFAAGNRNTRALKTDGSLWAWGAGVLGNGTINSTNRPMNIGNENDWSVIAAGGSYNGTFTLAIKKDRSLWAWGNNFYGQLGDGSLTDKQVPVRVGIESNWIAVAAGDLHAVAVKMDGSLWAWGYNKRQGLGGDGTTGKKSSPVRVGVENDWKAVAAGEDHTVLLKYDGSLWAWGDNGGGQLGDGTTASKNAPIRVGTNNNLVEITAGRNTSLGIRSDHTLWAWGGNDSGEVGDGTTINKLSPVQITTDSDWLTVSGGDDLTLAVKVNGSLWAWGYHDLGGFSVAIRPSPIRIGLENNWIEVSAGNSYKAHAIAMKNDGTLWGWEHNSSGQLGDGTSERRPDPVQIGLDTDWAAPVREP